MLKGTFESFLKKRNFFIFDRHKNEPLYTSKWKLSLAANIIGYIEVQCSSSIPFIGKKLQFKNNVDKILAYNLLII